MQKAFSRGLYVWAGGLDIVKFDKTLLIYGVSHLNLEGLGGAKPTKDPCGDGTSVLPNKLFGFSVLTNVNRFSYSKGLSIISLLCISHKLQR